jgi:predicted nicotinamide N-methyase
MPGYRTKQESVAVAGVRSLLIRSLADPRQYSDPHGDAHRAGISSANWPMFGLLWPSGAFLAARLAERPVRPGERILEIGCGLALASLVGHRRGADVTASDCHPLAEHFLQENLRLNGLAAMKYRHGRWGRPQLRAYGRAIEVMKPLPVPDVPDPRCIMTGRYDLIIGSDLLYERDPRGELAEFIACHALPGAEIWIIDPDRGNRSAFHRHMRRLGFGLEEMRLARPASAGVCAYKGRLLIYRPAAHPGPAPDKA